jgi:hypothetical protein
MKRPWYYENGVWKTKGTVDRRELNDWAAFYGQDFQGALALAGQGKIPMWFTHSYARHRCLRANRIFVRELIRVLTRYIYDPTMRVSNWMNRIGRAP